MLDEAHYLFPFHENCATNHSEKRFHVTRFSLKIVLLWISSMNREIPLNIVFFKKKLVYFFAHQIRKYVWNQTFLVEIMKKEKKQIDICTSYAEKKNR